MLFIEFCVLEYISCDAFPSGKVVPIALGLVCLVESMGMLFIYYCMLFWLKLGLFTGGSVW